MLWGKRRDSCKIVASINLQLTELLMQKPHDNSKASPAAFMQDNTLIAVIELSLSNWLVAGLIPGVPDVASALVDIERRAQFEQEGAHFESSYFLTFLYLSPPE